MSRTTNPDDEPNDNRTLPTDWSGPEDWTVPVELSHYWELLVETDATDPDTSPVTATYAADKLDRSRSNASRILLKLVDDDGSPVERGRPDNAFVYYIDRSEPATDADVAQAAPDAQGGAQGGTANARIPRLSALDDHADMVPDGVAEYLPQDDELAKLSAYMSDAAMNRTDDPQVLRLLGPSGCGKTHFAKYAAQEFDAAFYRLDCQEGTDGADILGSSVPVSGGWAWDDGVVTEAFRQSHNGMTVLLIDEWNRMRPEAANAAMQALAEGVVTLPERGNETVKCDPANMVIIGTMNPPSASYANFSEGFAQAQRWKDTLPMDYVGRTHFDREVSIVTRDAPDVTEAFAEIVVDFANEIRDKSEADPSGGFGAGGGSDPAAKIDLPITTKIAKAMVDRSADLAAVDMPDAAVSAAQGVLLETSYVEADPEARDHIQQRISDRFAGVDPAEFDPSGDDHTPHRNGQIGGGN